MRSGAVFRLQSASTRAVVSAVASSTVPVGAVVLGAVIGALSDFATVCCMLLKMLLLQLLVLHVLLKCAVAVTCKTWIR